MASQAAAARRQRSRTLSRVAVSASRRASSARATKKSWCNDIGGISLHAAVAPDPTLTGSRAPLPRERGRVRPRIQRRREILRGLDINRAGLTPTIRFQVVGNTLVGLQRLQAGLFHRADVDEGILAAILRLNKTV